jgi:predicted CXXCH cytochrome family protein
LALIGGVAHARTNPGPPHTDYRVFSTTGNLSGYVGGCAGNGVACHQVDKDKFLPATIDEGVATDFTNFCLSCHNAVGEAHDRRAGSPSTNAYVNKTGFNQDGPYRGDSHSWRGVSGNAGTRPPRLLGNMSTARMPNGDLVTCQVCHEGMGKIDGEENIHWESTTDLGDHKNYQLAGHANTRQHLAKYIRVYRSASAVATEPATRAKKLNYMVKPSEYTYDPRTAVVTFSVSQGVNKIYVDILQPYFRASNQSNGICLDCHFDRASSQATHAPGTGLKNNHPVMVKYGNVLGLGTTVRPAPRGNILLDYTAGVGVRVLCTSCHDPHNAASKDGQLLRNTGSDICGDCHKVSYAGYTGMLSNHNGAKHTSPTVCLDCHTTHGSNNVMLVRNVINGRRVTLQNLTGVGGLGDDSGNSVCEVCHTKTGPHKSDGTTAGHNTRKDCTRCHKHKTGFKGGGGGSSPCYDCHNGTVSVDIKGLMGLGSGAGSGGKASRHIIAFDNLSGSTCLDMCHTDHHESGSPNTKVSGELALCNTQACHNGGTGETSAGKPISIGANYASSLHNFTAASQDEFGLFRYGSANCTKCHVPHGSDKYPNLRPAINGVATNGNTEDLCFGCHNGNEPRAADIGSLWKANASNKGHYDYTNSKKMNCVKCHGPHGTGNSSMVQDSLGGPGLERDAICRACHSGNGGSVYNVMGSGPGSYGPDFSAASVHNFGLSVAIGGHTVDLTCEGCHDPHNTKNARLLQDRVVFSGFSTVAVQPVSAAVQPQGPITSYTGGWSNYCAICHTSMKETGGQSPYRRHPVDLSPGTFYPHTTAFNMGKLPLDSGQVSCITCHYTHGSPKPSLLRFKDAVTPENRMCLQCHENDKFLQGGQGSHGGFVQNQGRCSDCHNMHTKANKKLLNEATESVLCYQCHGGSGLSKYNVWKPYTTLDNPFSLQGTGGTFGAYSELQGGTAHSMHDINEESTQAPGGVTTQHRCGTCHNPHGSKNYRILRSSINNVTGINVYARMDSEGNFVNYSTGFVRFCSACHAAYTTTDDGNGNWIRHPVGVRLDGYSSERYNYANNTTYKPKVELETGGTVSCVSCHFAHGSGADANLKFPSGRSVNTCKTCHNRDSFAAGTPGSHAGFVGNNGTCSDCHSMHAKGNAKLLKDDAETAICVNCHDNPGTSTSPNPSHLDVWKGNVFGSPTSWFGTAGSFGYYDPVNGGDAYSMHPVNSDARIAPGDSATVVHCGTCHDTHGSPNYRLLKTKLNGKSGISVLANLDSRGHTTSYISGMSGFCTACHKAYINCGTAAGYTRHPVDVALTAQQQANYDAQHGGKYLPLESGNRVTCTTCHFAHGSPNPDMKRLPGNQMCQICHAQGLDAANGYHDVMYTHGGFNGSGGDCTVCHSMHTANNRKLLIYAEESELCYSCHGPDGARRPSYPAAQVVWKGDAPSYPTQWDGTGGSFGAFYNSTTGGSSRSRHEINKTDSAAPGGTTTEHRCGTCHNPHGNNNYRLLRDDVNGMSGIKVRVGPMGNYSSGMSSFCTACHTMYGQTGTGVDGYRRHPVNLKLTSDEKSNLAGSPLEPKAQVEGGKVMCLSCHFAHGSPSYSMLRMQSYSSSQSELCQQCHKKGYNSQGQQVSHTHGGFNGNDANCGVCHSVHAKNNKKLLMEAKEADLCNNCHSGIAKFTAFKAEDPEVKINAPSRFNVFSSIGNSFGNYSVGGGDVVSWHSVDGTHTAPAGKTLELRCGKCHNPHGGDNFVMLRDSVEGVNNIRVFGHLSSTGPFNTYSSGFGTFCSACHTRLTNCGSGNPWTRHPVDFTLKDKQYANWSSTPIAPKVPLEAGGKVTCITCHNSHGSKNYSLQRLGGNGMCQQCHKR